MQRNVQMSLPCYLVLNRFPVRLASRYSEPIVCRSDSQPRIYRICHERASAASTNNDGGTEAYQRDVDQGLRNEPPANRCLATCICKPTNFHLERVYVCASVARPSYRSPHTPSIPYGYPLQLIELCVHGYASAANFLIGSISTSSNLSDTHR
ncbi:hypothetical protein CC77DRAFT_576437 [Alternaria alternata]|uniref:Uncharacterized protein n=1 Tax=Alternaria alternata TaxID=5599 RepID=A0A177D4Z9_ALTAL|nr:hypothetical protein CC77DRAFT_576437 [Alternaria alternata]OAG14220.1 hypothetical protein CC77DRAFT_576437 [Alternaria alternata]